MTEIPLDEIAKALDEDPDTIRAMVQTLGPENAQKAFQGMQYVKFVRDALKKDKTEEKKKDDVPEKPLGTIGKTVLWTVGLLGTSSFLFSLFFLWHPLLLLLHRLLVV